MSAYTTTMEAQVLTREAQRAHRQYLNATMRASSTDATITRLHQDWYLAQQQADQAVAHLAYRPERDGHGRWNVYSRRHGEVVTTGLTLAQARQEILDLERQDAADHAAFHIDVSGVCTCDRPDPDPDGGTVCLTCLRRLPRVVGDPTRCKSTHPGGATLNGRPVRCELAAGHDGQHGHSFAARYWYDSQDRCQATRQVGAALDRCELALGHDGQHQRRMKYTTATWL